MIQSPVMRGHLAMLLFSALVAGSFSLGALATPFIAPSALTVARFALAAGLVGAVVAARGHLTRRAFAAPWRYVVLGALLACYFVLMFEGLRTAPPVSIAAVFTLAPLIGAGFGWVLLGQATTRRMAIALLLGAMGALWVVFRGDLHALLGFQVVRGEVIFFAGCVAYAAYAPLSRRFNRGETAGVFTFGTLLAGCGVLAVYGAREVWATDWATLPGIVWVCLIYVAVAASAASFVLIQYATMRLPSAKVLAYTYLVPVWVIGWEVALGRPLPPLATLGGVVLTLAAVGLLLKDEGAVAG